MSVRRKSRRYLRNAAEASHEFQEFLDENPMVAQGLASVGNLLMNALMQSKYGPVVQKLMNPESAAAEQAAAAKSAPPGAASQSPPKSARPTPNAKQPGARRRASAKAAKAK